MPSDGHRPLSPSDKVFVAGHRGMVGSAVVRSLRKRSFDRVVEAGREVVDLADQSSTFAFLQEQKPDVVVVAAAKVGGIVANATYPAEFAYDNIAIAANLIEGSRRAGVERLMFLGSSCIYPKFAPQPIKEEHLLTGALEPTNEAYAVAKIAGIKLCAYYRQQYGLDYRSVLPSNLYGPGDNYHPENSHVLPAFIRRFSEAKDKNLDSVTIWGTGTPLREFLHADDCAEGLIHVLERPESPDIVNLGSGEEISIADLASLVADVVGFKGEIDYDKSKPDGTPRKLMDASVIRSLGWSPKIGLREGIAAAVEDFKSRYGVPA
ncbi:MAG: GDP-L-fucose synthase [Armatimonadetes bacterium]|nr:GDP-L-fucose synthase [Armatimonadota bacterium]